MRSHGPVQAGGTVVRSGDVVVGDGDGVVVLPHERAAEVVALAQARLRDEEEQFAQIAAGTLDRSWVLKTLTEVHVDGGGNPMSRRWGLIGFGEAGRIIGGALAASGAELQVHDRVLLDPARGTAVREAVHAAGATPVDDLAEFADRDVVVSLVTPATAVPAAQGFAPHAADGVLYVDLNSTAPGAKHEVAAALPGSGWSTA